MYDVPPCCRFVFAGVSWFIIFVYLGSIGGALAAWAEVAAFQACLQMFCVVWELL